jgi:ABC-type proline/glycine betaine transport systems, ATPase components
MSNGRPNPPRKHPPSHYGGAEGPGSQQPSRWTCSGEKSWFFVVPPGWGKSTTLRFINRLMEPGSGKIYLDGKDVTDINPQ